jgi:diguanylate cyclase (GGDEF)-like protein
MEETGQDFLSNPKILENQALLRDIGVLTHIDKLNREIRSYKSLLAGAAEIFNRTSIDEIMDAAVWQVSDQFLPSFIVFLWRPFQNREDVTIRSYQNYKPVNLALSIDTIAPFEAFFEMHREPVNYALLKRHLTERQLTERQLTERQTTEQREMEGIFRSLDVLKPELVAPILGPPGLYGLILVGPKLLAGNYTPPELLFLQQLMSFVSQAIQNHLHYEHSLRDVKTGLFNHGFLTTRLQEEIARSERTGCASSLIAIDVDAFKKVNDRCGHLAGDRVLETIARMIKQSVRTGDVPSRFGGEEFTILLPNTGGETAWQVAERMRLAIESMTVPWDTPLPQVTISLGIVTFDRDSNLSVDEVIHRADEALYQSKATGKNCTSIWQGGILFKVENTFSRR